MTTGPLTVVPGSRVVNGVGVGFPHTAQGLVSAAAEDISQLESTLSPDRAAAVMRVVAATTMTDGPEQAAQGTTNSRAALRLPTSGPLPPGVSVVTSPQMYQVWATGPDAATVPLLCVLSLTNDGGSASTTAVFPLRMVWDNGDWRVAGMDGADHSGLEAQPDSVDAAAKGWQPLMAASG